VAAAGKRLEYETGQDWVNSPGHSVQRSVVNLPVSQLQICQDQQKDQQKTVLSF
jgi:hypothetical protein